MEEQEKSPPENGSRGTENGEVRGTVNAKEGCLNVRLQSYDEGWESLGVPAHERASYGWIKPEKRFRAEYKTPADSGRKTALARQLLYDLPPNSAATLVVQNHDIWISSENEYLFTTFRDLAAKQPPRSVDDAPVLQFENGELKLFECFFAIAMYFYWDTVAIVGKEPLIISLSHDEFFKIQTDDETRFQHIIALLNTSGYEAM